MNLRTRIEEFYVKFLAKQGENEASQRPKSIHIHAIHVDDINGRPLNVLYSIRHYL